MKTNYVLIDYENVAVKSIASLKGEYFRVLVFVGPKNTKINADLAMAMQALGTSAKYIKLESSGPNALDFHIAYYLGKLSSAEPEAFYHVISKDKGFDPLLDHLRGHGVECARSVSIEEMPCFATATAKIVDKPVVEKTIVEKPVIATTVKTVTKTKAGPATKMKAEELVGKMVINLKNLGIGTPKSEKALKGKIKNWCGTAYSEKEVEAVFNRLVKKGLVKVVGTKVEYKLV